VLIGYRINDPYDECNTEGYKMFLKFENLRKNKKYKNALELYDNWKMSYKANYGIFLPRISVMENKLDEGFTYFFN
jgi:hypothetical protein